MLMLSGSDAVLGYGHRENNLRAVVVDTLQVWFELYHDRTSKTHCHETWLDAYLGPAGGIGTGGAIKYKLPVRIDQALPSDHLASAVLNWPAAVSARTGGDMDGGNTWRQMASSGAFLSALHIRPIMDVLWTQAVQPDSTEHISGAHRARACDCHADSWSSGVWRLPAATRVSGNQRDQTSSRTPH